MESVAGLDTSERLSTGSESQEQDAAWQATSRREMCFLDLELDLGLSTGMLEKPDFTFHPKDVPD